MKVSARGRVMCCKIADDRTCLAIDRELRCLQQISVASLDPPLRIPKLCGIIRSGNDSILGILMTNISPYSETPRLGLVDVITVVIARRKKWASQIKATIEKLHDVGVVWGDAKADNILIDKNDDTWIIDFDGGVDKTLGPPRISGQCKG